jgi:hypothetical protein
VFNIEQRSYSLRTGEPTRDQVAKTVKNRSADCHYCHAATFADLALLMGVEIIWRAFS